MEKQIYVVVLEKSDGVFPFTSNELALAFKKVLADHYPEEYINIYMVPLLDRIPEPAEYKFW